MLEKDIETRFNASNYDLERQLPKGLIKGESGN